MYDICASQIKAARALLDWSQEELAKASDVSLSTVRNFENGFCLRRDLVTQIRKALEKAGVEFTECEGVSRRNDAVKVYRSADSCEMFFNNLLQTVEKHGGDILCVTQSQDMLLHSCGVTGRDNTARLEILNNLAPVKCLVPETASFSTLPQSFQFRTTSKHHLGPYCYYIFGNKCAQVIPMGRTEFLYVVYRVALVTDTYRTHFMSLWDNALPLVKPIAERSVQVSRSFQ
jgi:transcriptional regulator with XRE-family HTH domain